MTTTTHPVSAADLAAARAELTSPVISDTLDALGYRNQCLAAGLSALDLDAVVAGYAYPVHIQRVFDVPENAFEGLLEALDNIGPDEVFITPTSRATDIAVWGELLSTAAQVRGAAGAITDGLIRDTRAIRGLGFPVFSAGTIPLDSKGRHEIVAHRVACTIDGIRIEPGDIVFADSDGVVIIPRGVAARVLKGALAKRATEKEFRDAVAGGMLTQTAYEKFGVL